MKQALLISSFVGGGIPIIWLLLWEFMKKYCEQCVNWVIGSEFLDITLLILWPSSILMIGDPMDSNTGLRALAVILNILFYAVVGGLIWLAVFKSKMFFIPVAYSGPTGSPIPGHWDH